MALCSPPPTAPRLLQIHDLADLLELLRQHGYSGVTYYDLGLYLGLSPVTLDVIRKDNERDIQICLRECLKIWLQKADDVDKKGGPTIHSLISALKKIKEKAVAVGIDMEKHPACKIFADHTSSQSQVLASLSYLAPLLHFEKLIKKMIYSKDEEHSILIEVQEAICLDHYKLEVFATVLLKCTDTAGLGNVIMKKYREAYCENELMKMENADLQVDHSAGLKIYLPKSLTLKFKSMRLKYGRTFFKVGSIMMQNYPPAIADDMKQLLTFYDKELKPSLAQCQKISEILEIVWDKCSLNDIEILEFIVNELDIDEAKLVVQEYNEAIKEFSEMKLSQCLKEKFSYGSPLSCEKVTIVVDQEAADLTLKDVRRLSGEIFRDLVPQIKLCVIRDDQSFTVICSFPLSLTEQLIAIALESIEILKENKVKRLTIGYCTVYEVDEVKPAEEEQQQSLYGGTGTLKQLMLTLSVQFLSSKDEIRTLNEKMLSHGKEAELLRNILGQKTRMLKARSVEDERKSESLQSLQRKFIELEAETVAVKERKQLLEEQLALFQSEKEDSLESEDQPNNKGVKQLKKSLSERDKEIKILQNKISSISIQGIEKDEVLNNIAAENEKLKLIIDETSQSLETDSHDEQIKFLTQQLEISKTEKKELEISLAESKKEIEALQEKISTISVQKLSPKERISIDDDIYGDIEIDNALLIRIVKTRQFQRLKDIKQSGYTFQKSYSRFEHSIGMGFIAGKIVKQFKKRQPELNISDNEVLCVQIAAFCFNLGHGPFSYVFKDYLREVETSERSGKSYSQMMLKFMIEDNNLPLDEHLADPEQDIEFIEELMTGNQGPQAAQHEDKTFLYEIVVNRISGLDANMLDCTLRDAAILGKNINFKWKAFLNKIEVKLCPDGKRHICATEEHDLKIYTELFAVRHSLFKELYYHKKNRAVATMIMLILKKCGETKLVRGADG
ncbi:PREDICTED: uncharacterized protein LOC109584024 [Amphimedon queenslandica]|nr:PREDICTED: uncharacterized protein LOC109584024 [Amphimedon queenslandica]|eukprot:XP_019855145.1 PREDICTED: uncharacterized protein LOC109584024 [Amphimedon queenslandica]